MRLFEEKYYEPSLLCAHYLSYYGYIAPLFENLPDVASKLKRAFDVGLSMGFVSNEALMAGQHYIQKSFFAGTSLTTILAENEQLIKLAAKYKDSTAERYSRQVCSILLQAMFMPNSFCQSTNHGHAAFRLFYQTLCVLTKTDNKFPLTDTEEGYEGFALVQLFHRAIQSFWLEHYDRCNYFVSKSTSDKVNENSKAYLRKLQVKRVNVMLPIFGATHASTPNQGIYCFFYQATSASALLRVSKKRLSELTGGKFPILPVRSTPWHFRLGSATDANWTNLAAFS